MRRFLWIPAIIIRLVGSLFIALASMTYAELSTFGQPKQSKSAITPGSKTQGVHKITVTPWGPDQMTIDKTKITLLRDPGLKAGTIDYSPSILWKAV